jgi:hypothetical protein
LPFALFPQAYQQRHHRRFARACHATYKDGYDYHGRPARIGGTMCYDRFGRAYIVPGSRYVIRYH